MGQRTHFMRRSHIYTNINVYSQQKCLHVYADKTEAVIQTKGIIIAIKTNGIPFLRERIVPLAGGGSSILAGVFGLGTIFFLGT